MPYFPPVLLRSGSGVGATNQVQEFTNGIAIGGAQSGSVPMTINQPVDSGGIIILGYDDQASATFQLNINAGGSGVFSTTGNMIFLSTAGTQIRFNAAPSGDIRLANSANAVGLIMDSNQQVGIGGIVTMTSWLHVQASTTARASLRIPAGVAPTSPNDGDIWTDATGIFIRINGATYSVDLTAV